jgi:hypothetical protein
MWSDEMADETSCNTVKPFKVVVGLLETDRDPDQILNTFFRSSLQVDSLPIACERMMDLAHEEAYNAFVAK